jgi:hypothetical protein
VAHDGCFKMRREAVAIVEEKEVGLKGLLVLSKRPFRQSLASYVLDMLNGDYETLMNLGLATNDRPNEFGVNWCRKGTVERIVRELH